MAGSGRSWFYKRHGKKYGPLTSAQLKAAADNGMLLPTDLLWREGMKVWAPAGKLKGLFHTHVVEAAFASQSVSAEPVRYEGRKDPAVRADTIVPLVPPEPHRSSRSSPPVKSEPEEVDLLAGLPPPDPHLLAAGAKRAAALEAAKNPQPQAATSRWKHYDRPAGGTQTSFSTSGAPVGFFRRLAGGIVDVFVLFAINVGFLLVVIPLQTIFRSKEGGPSPVMLVVALIQLVNLFVQLRYLLFADASPSRLGSMGKAAVGAIVVTERGEAIGSSRCLIRSVIKCLSLLMPLLFLVVAFHPRKRGLHDMIAGTKVISG